MRLASPRVGKISLLVWIYTVSGGALAGNDSDRSAGPGSWAFNAWQQNRITNSPPRSVAVSDPRIIEGENIMTLFF
ncbi:MAG: hypothetical protein ACOX5K_05660 [Bacteroidales bacterium]